MRKRGDVVGIPSESFGCVMEEKIGVVFIGNCEIKGHLF